MRILFLDDNEIRHRAFRRVSIGHVVDHVYTAAEAIARLDRADVYDLVYLDHDLDWQATAGLTPLEETGQHVAEHIVGMPRARRPRAVRVHSFNPVGGPRMIAILRSAGIPAVAASFSEAP